MKSPDHLLYLGFAFPPGVQALHPEINPAGHRFETAMVKALGNHFEIRSVGVLPFAHSPLPVKADPNSGVSHQLILEDHFPELWHRYRALWRLKRQYQHWNSAGWKPDVVFVYNLSPIYNQFIRWLRRQLRRPKLVLYLLDSSQLGAPLPRLKRLRFRLKPMKVPEDEMILSFDACIGASPAVEGFFTNRSVPFLWIPGACAPSQADMLLNEHREDHWDTRPVQFGYFGALSGHAGVFELAQVFLQTTLDATLHICGYGKLAATFCEMAQADSRLQFHGLLPSPEDCLRFGRDCDILINPRLPTHGNQNNFASKLFDYAQCGRAILASRMSGVDQVLGPDAFYFNPTRFNDSLRRALTDLADLPRKQLHERGERIRKRITNDYTWPIQAERMAKFLVTL